MARLDSRKGALPHVEWVDLKADGTLIEVAVVKKDEQGNTYFFELNKLDAIDRQRLFNIITKRHGDKFELWDLLSQHTLGNGMNALTYYHQLVKILTPSGTIIDPKAGVIGVRAGVVKPKEAAPADATPVKTEEQPQ
ncbi:hypothetical protein LCGC14_1904090 [marine sediment metagenome]|uniref:Uncharacterized protein n=1 Tax=marine sediment metagenome TaxID=412755 RepID=A0A0F9I9L2_9ZZZZ|nr:hypothetical protein [Methylophaga sp.]